MMIEEKLSFVTDNLLQYPPHFIDSKTLILLADCVEWMNKLPSNSIHAIVTDPPYGIKEYQKEQLEKRTNGNGGIWRIPPSFDGHKRSPLPRFTALNGKDRGNIRDFFYGWAKVAIRIMRPGAHLFLASNVFLSQIVFAAIVDAGFEFRGQIIRLVKTFRGGDRPKNAEKEFPNVCTLPRGSFEPWGIFRKPVPRKMSVSECLREFGTGGLRRKPDGVPFEDVIKSQRTPQNERKIAPHPSLKPQDFMRRIVYASLPLGKGAVIDPFMGGGATVAAAKALGYTSIGIEVYQEYFDMAQKSIPQLADLHVAYFSPRLL